METGPHRRASYLVVAGLLAVNGLFASMWWTASDTSASGTWTDFGIVLIAITATFGIVRLLVTGPAVPGKTRPRRPAPGD